MLQALTPLVEMASIDEAYLDLSGSERLHGGPPIATLIRLQRRIETETGLTVSIGLAANKAMAKFASEMDKPRGFAVIGRRDAAAILAPRPVRALSGVGPGLAKRLTDAGIDTIGDVAAAPQDVLFRLAGGQAARLARLARGEDDRPVDPHGDRKSISAETTFDQDLRDAESLEAILWSLAERVGRRARDSRCAGRVVTLKLKTARFETVTRRRTLAEATQLARTIFAAAREMLAAETGAVAYRLIGVGLSELTDPDDADRGDLIDTAPRRLAALERAEDRLRARFGSAALVTGRSLSTKPRAERKASGQQTQGRPDETDGRET
jgi:DNA polymerase-4